MREFELTFLLNPDLVDEKVEEIVGRVKDIIAKGGEVGEVNVWGKRRMAYPIQFKDDAIYVFVPFRSGPDVPTDLTRFFGINEDVMRHLIVHAIPEPPVIEPRVVTRKTEIFIPPKAVKTAETDGESAPAPEGADGDQPSEAEAESKGVDDVSGEVSEETPASSEAVPEG